MNQMTKMMRTTLVMTVRSELTLISCKIHAKTSRSRDISHTHSLTISKIKNNLNRVSFDYLRLCRT